MILWCFVDIFSIQNKVCQGVTEEIQNCIYRFLHVERPVQSLFFWKNPKKVKKHRFLIKIWEISLLGKNLIFEKTVIFTQILKFREFEDPKISSITCIRLFVVLSKRFVTTNQTFTRGDMVKIISKVGGGAFFFPNGQIRKKNCLIHIQIDFSISNINSFTHYDGSRY